jgi:glucosamine-6-phosphate deaminase
MGQQYVEQVGNVCFIQLKDADAVGQEAALQVERVLIEKPGASIVFPTGKTPLPMYRHLRRIPYLRWISSRLFHLDEYIRPYKTGPIPYELYADYMNRELWGCVGGQKFYFAHYTERLEEYDALVRANGGPDLVILGIGSNGHIAFNEPGSPPDAPTRKIDLADQTLISNFGDVGKPGYPKQAATIGLKTILGARKIILLATGQGKQEIVRGALDPAVPPSLNCPASWLKQHPCVTVIADFEP